ncbi:MAG: polysaccharide deacetylase family protein [Actinomycetota bacterium]|nr:polysaccharide deacetylase family protein [Actinomycetota bacterium]
MPVRLRSHRGFQVLVVVLVLALPLAIVSQLHDPPPPVPIVLNGSPTTVPNLTRFGTLLKSRHLHAKDGRLLDVQGKVLNPHKDPGQITLNGSDAGRGTLLHPGDHIEVVNGKDSTERTVTKRTTLPGKQPGNPEFTLKTGEVQQITVEGRISGEVVSIRYAPKGNFTTPPEVALTFDDGPWPGSSARILSILEKMHVKATFFVIGNLVARYPDMVRREANAGMTIANHSWDHPNTPPFNTLPARRIDNEMSMTNDELQKLGIHPKLFRPPGGSYDDQLITIAQKNGLRVVNWNVDPRDWAPGATAKMITKNVLANVGPGSIVDLHDGGGDQSATVAAIPDIIKGIRKQGLELVAFGG